jgi:hypothetical protein
LFNRLLRSADISSLFLRCVGDPISKLQISFVIKNWHATLAFPPFELQKGSKTLLPKMVAPVPNKSYRVQTTFAPGWTPNHRVGSCLSSRWPTVPFALSKSTQCRKAPFPPLCIRFLPSSRHTEPIQQVGSTAIKKPLERDRKRHMLFRSDRVSVIKNSCLRTRRSRSGGTNGFANLKG